MKKTAFSTKAISICLALCLVLSVFSGISVISASAEGDAYEIATSYAGGSGTETDPYHIETADQLYKMVREGGVGADGTSKGYFVLDNDIVLNDTTDWAPDKANTKGYKNWSAGVTDTSTKFIGDFDGQYHTISGLYANNSDCNGFIHRTNADVTIKNVCFENAYVHGSTYVGTVIGYAEGGCDITFSQVLVNNSKLSSGWGTSAGLIGEATMKTGKRVTFMDCAAINVDAPAIFIHASNAKPITRFYGCWAAGCTATDYPLIQSIIYSFSEIVIVPGGVETKFVGLEHYHRILFVSSGYTDALKGDLVEFLYSLPIILLLSMVLAIMLNQKFRGRLFFRALYFLPVIIATGTVINLIFGSQSGDTQSFERGTSEAFSSNMLSVDEIVKWLDINSDLGEYITNVIGKIFDLIWNCGIQIVLFLAGLQSIPSSLYEASRVEGATKWEEFWFITFPMLSQVTLLVGVFTMVELIAGERGTMVSWTYELMLGGTYDYTSAMIWFYFLVSGLVMGILVFLYNRILMRRWET